jgi:hypothetical protein
LPKENEPKERAPVSLGPTDFPVLLEAAGSLKTRRYAQTVQTPFTAASVVLSSVPMGKFLEIILKNLLNTKPNNTIHSLAA